MKKLLSLFFGLGLLFIAPITIADAQTTATPTPAQGIVSAQQQITSDNADIAAQDKIVASATAQGNTQAAQAAVDQKAVDYADVAYQNALITGDQDLINNASATQINTDKANVNAASAELNNQKATQAKDQGNVSAAEQAATNAQIDANGAKQNATNAATSATGNFVPLTNIPVLNGLTTAPNLPAFLNAVYKYMIGIAATLAVIEIMYAGIQYMGGDSITETKQARARIENAVLGLVIVLAPALVFGFINPKILNLDLSSDFSSLGTSAAPAATPAQTTATPAQLPNYGSSTVLPTPLSNASSIPAQDNNVNAPTTIPITNTSNINSQLGGGTAMPTTLGNYGKQ